MATKRKRNADKIDDGLTSKKSLLQDDTQDNNNDDNGNTAAKAVKPVKTDAQNKLPEDILKRYLSEPGQLLIAGNVLWEACGGKKGRKELVVFNRFTDAKYRAIYSGPTSSHSVLIDENLKAHSFGRNNAGQCGHKQLETFNKPAMINGLKNVNIIAAACGRVHTLFLSDTGAVYASGDNKNGQLGVGKKVTSTMEPIRIKYDGPPICKIGCGVDFSVILDIEGNLYTFGHPDMGQLGNGTDGKYFNAHNKLVFDTQYYPKQVTSFIEKAKNGHSTPVSNVKLVDFACGKNHTIAIDSEKRAFSFGFGGFGRLGHNEPSDEPVPRLIKYLNMRITGGANHVYCGSASSFVISGHGNPYSFGQRGKHNEIYPKIVNELCGIKIKGVSCSATSTILTCEVDGINKLIAWGPSPTYGELGIGKDPKSSAQPTFVDCMDGVNISQVAMGQEHTLLLVNNNEHRSNEKYLAQPEYIPEDDKTSK